MKYSDQTISDCLLLPSRPGSSSVVDIFDFTRTSGGGECLRQMITTRLGSVQEILDMQDAIRYASEHISNLDFEVINADLHYINEYFRVSNNKRGPSIGIIAKLKYKYTSDAGYSYTRSNVMRILFFLNGIRKRLPANTDGYPKILKQILDRILAIVDEPGHSRILFADPVVQDVSGIVKADYYLQHHFRVLFDEIMDNLFRLEAIVSVAKASRKHSFVFPGFSSGNTFVAEGLFHVLIPQAVRNDLSIDDGKNILFLTGANMSGKSSFLRTIGALVCLAHAGFPVPAKSLSIPFYDVISVNISVQDDMMKGYSRFYNEMLLVKNLLHHLGSGKKCFAIFDELFSGTNLNDAISCSKILLHSLKQYSDSLVIISSHNVQMAGDGTDNMQFSFIDSGIENGKPVFSYQVKPGKNETALGLFLFEQMRAELQNAGMVI